MFKMQFSSIQKLTSNLSSLRIFGQQAAKFSSNSLTKLSVDDKGVAVLEMNRPPVNGLNLDLLTELNDSIKEVEKNRSTGLILTSSLNTVFSGGLDITEMYKPDQERLKSFWTRLQDTWLALYGTMIPTVAVVNGHSPAGGCLLATACEYRIMLPKYTIGLNETKLGIVAPQWFMDTYLNVLPRRLAESALTQGRMFSTEEAMSVGLIDAIADNKEIGLEKAKEILANFKNINPAARGLTKQLFRSKELQNLENNRKSDLDQFLFIINQKKVQDQLGIYMESLKKKAKA